jgi:hypothetical protein
MSKIEWTDATINPLGWGCYGPGALRERGTDAGPG